MIYVIKLKKAEEMSPMYCNRQLMIPIKDIGVDNNLSKDWFFLSLNEAKSLSWELISRATDPRNEEDFEYISIVELSNYEPYTEHQVLFYKEFSK